MKWELFSSQAISEGEDLEELLKQQERRRLAMEAALEAEEVRNIGELEIRLNEEHKEEVKQLHKTLLEKVRVILLLGTFHLPWDGESEKLFQSTSACKWKSHNWLTQFGQITAIPQAFPSLALKWCKASQSKWQNFQGIPTFDR